MPYEKSMPEKGHLVSEEMSIFSAQSKFDVTDFVSLIIRIWTNNMWLKNTL